MYIHANHSVITYAHQLVFRRLEGLLRLHGEDCILSAGVYRKWMAGLPHWPQISTIADVYFYLPSCHNVAFKALSKHTARNISANITNGYDFSHHMPILNAALHKGFLIIHVASNGSPSSFVCFLQHL